MSIFDKLRSASDIETNKVLGSNISSFENRIETFTFAKLPESISELQALPESTLDSPFKTAALTVLALCVYVAVKVVYGDKSITSDEFEIQKASDAGMRGDVDNDKKVSVMDATIIQMYSASLVDLTADQKKRGDVDDDTKVSVLDATKIQMFVAQLIPEL